MLIGINSVFLGFIPNSASKFNISFISFSYLTASSKVFWLKRLNCDLITSANKVAIAIMIGLSSIFFCGESRSNDLRADTIWLIMERLGVLGAVARAIETCYAISVLLS